MRKLLIISYLLLFTISCIAQFKEINSAGKTVSARFLLPEGYIRQPVTENSFAGYLRNFPLKPSGTKVYLYDNSLKDNQEIHGAVLDIDRGTRDLQQCADAVMRLRAEYLYKQQKINEIHFKNFAGTDMDFLRYAQGYRITQKGYLKTASPDNSKKSFRNYLEMVFSYANTFTLEKEMKMQELKDLQIGDVFIVSNPNRYGHAVIVMDIAENPKTKNKLFLLAQSYMPAQDIHILKNANDSGNTFWYSLNEIKIELKTPEWIFPQTALHKF